MISLTDLDRQNVASPLYSASHIFLAVPYLGFLQQYELQTRVFSYSYIKKSLPEQWMRRQKAHCLHSRLTFSFGSFFSMGQVRQWSAAGAKQKSRKYEAPDEIREENQSLRAKLSTLEHEVQDLRRQNAALFEQLQSVNGLKQQDCTQLVFGPAPASDSRQANNAISMEISTLTDVDVLFAGLSYCGFDRTKQNRVNIDRNLRRFKSFFGVPPTTVVPILTDLKNVDPDVIYRDILMAMNWLYLYESREVLSGRWGPCENEIGKRCIMYAQKLQTLKRKKILCEVNHDGDFPFSYDTVTFLVQEFRLDPSAKWFDHKSHSSGLVSSIFYAWKCFSAHFV